MKFDSKPLEEHQEVPLPDEGRWERIVEHWEQRDACQSPSEGLRQAYVVSVALRQDAHPPSRLEEMLGLARAQGDRIAGQEILRLARPDPRALFRSGTAQALAERARGCGADLLVIDALLSPSQTRNLEDATGLPVRDREAVILHVFQRNVKTRKARIQVEIAHLEYLRPRIRGLGLEMDQQAGGITGSRGPGETASELLARQLDGRLVVLRQAFASIARDSEVQRKARSTCKTIALVGYTNAGKTSLMNQLTRSSLLAADRPFATLDTTSRCLSRHGGDVLVSDTVGFIRDLPERLFASFATTLAEINEASLLALVVDISDEEAEHKLRATEDVLQKLDAGALPRFYIFTKIDKLAGAPSAAQLAALSAGHPHLALCTGDAPAVASLREALLQSVRHDQKRCSVLVPYAASEASAMVYRTCRVLHAEAREAGIHFTIEADAHQLAVIKKAAKIRRQA